jgi:hypothetical protein
MIGATVAAPGAPTNSPAPTNGLVAILDADGNTEDGSGKGHHGRVVGDGFSYAADRYGTSGWAYRFSGAGGAVQIPDAEDLRAGEAFTVAAWINPRVHRINEPDACGAIVWKWYTWGGGGEYMFSLLSDGKIALTVAQGVTPEEAQTIVSTGPAPVDRWTHVAATFDRGALKLYMNGVLNTGLVSKVVTRAYAPRYSNGDVKIGGPGRGGTPYSFDGAIDEVRIYNRSLTPAEILSTFTSGPGQDLSPETQETIVALIRNLGDSKAGTRKEARARLKALGRQAIPVLIRYRNDPDPEIRLSVEELLTP